MKAPLQTVAEDAFLYRAIGRIERLGFRHLGVTNAAGEIVGAVTTRNLLRHRATTAIMLGDEIDSAPSRRRIWLPPGRKLPLMARDLMEEEVDPRTISAVVSSEICGMTRRAAELGAGADARRGPGRRRPFPSRCLCWARRVAARASSRPTRTTPSSTRTGAKAEPEDRLLREARGEHMSEILDAAGVPFCKGGVMAKNREWRKSVADWRATIDGWVRRQRPQTCSTSTSSSTRCPCTANARWARRSGTTPTSAATRPATSRTC